MRWHRERDYHGSRTYSAEEPSISQVSLTIAWLFAMLRGKLRKAGPRPSSTVLLHDGKHSFSLLGANDHARRDIAECAFPTKPAAVNHCDWRVLP